MSVDLNPHQHLANFRCNVFAGSDIGYLKGVTFATKTFRNLNTVEKLNKKIGISCMCWGKEDESEIYAGCKGGDIFHHNQSTRMNKFVLMDNDERSDCGDLKEICAFDSCIVSAFQNGAIFVNKVESEESILTTSLVDTLYSLGENKNSIKNLQCMDHNKSQKIATGGKDNVLKIWDVNSLSSDPLFVAKNVKNDWLSLQVPIWVTKAKFYPDGNKVITGTGIGKVRMYDPTSKQRRPVIEVQCEEEYPITGLDIRTNSDYQVFAGNTVGTLLAIDLRMKSVLKAFKGNKGGVTDIKSHPKFPIFAVCSADRYVRCYDPDQKSSLIHSFYVNSSLNCLLFSSDWEKQDYHGNESEEKCSDIQKGDKPVKRVNKETSDNEEDDVWNKMEVIQRKKKKIKSK